MRWKEKTESRREVSNSHRNPKDTPSKAFLTLSWRLLGRKATLSQPKPAQQKRKKQVRTTLQNLGKGKDVNTTMAISVESKRHFKEDKDKIVILSYNQRDLMRLHLQVIYKRIYKRINTLQIAIIHQLFAVNISWTMLNQNGKGNQACKARYLSYD